MLFSRPGHGVSCLLCLWFYFLCMALMENQTWSLTSFWSKIVKKEELNENFIIGEGTPQPTI